MYVYKFKAEEHNRKLVEREMQAIFKLPITSEWIVTEQDINPNKSYYINYKIDVLATANKIDQLKDAIKALNLYYENFKIEFVDVKSDVIDYNERINYCRTIADGIEGSCKMIDPDLKIVITKTMDAWVIGKLIKNDRSFERLQNKPHSYSHSMSAELSRTLVNILCGQDKPKILDPCCGIGTVVIDGLDQGYDIIGTELNWLVANKAKENLEHLDLPIVISRQDMHTIKERYDVTILDLPYGLMSKTSTELQTGLIANCYNLSNKLLLVTNEDSSHLIENTKWQLSELIEIPKANYQFTRYMYLLTK